MQKIAVTGSGTEYFVWNWREKNKLTTQEPKLKAKFNKNQRQRISHITISKWTHTQPFLFESLHF